MGNDQEDGVFELIGKALDALHKAVGLGDHDKAVDDAVAATVPSEGDTPSDTPAETPAEAPAAPADPAPADPPAETESTG